MAKKLTEAFFKKYPDKISNNIYEELSYRKNVLAAIESYLFMVFENTEECNRNEVANNVCRNTLAYSLANDQEKNMLEVIFEAITKKISHLVGVDIHRYSSSMAGFELSKKN